MISLTHVRGIKLSLVIGEWILGDKFLMKPRFPKGRTFHTVSLHCDVNQGFDKSACS